ncbi:MAG: secretion system protein E, partial [Verrucomicrobiae bacterium]|nr:secretion system protein E [Verrucomicrobiae bacterium]
MKSFGERIADALIEDSLLTTAQVEELLTLQKKEGTRLLKLLIDKAYVSDLDMVVAMGRVLNVPPVNIAKVGIPPEVIALIPKEMSVNFKVLPV